MHSPTPENYHVALKSFIRNGDDILILHESHSDKHDLPGGRIGVGEFEMPLEEILRREIDEELGQNFKYKNNGPVAFFRHRRPENTIEGKPEVRVFMIGFELEYLGGDIILSHEHDSWQWVPLAEAIKMLPGGQQNGIEK